MPASSFKTSCLVLASLYLSFAALVLPTTATMPTDVETNLRSKYKSDEKIGKNASLG
jgi:hypothetical protein